MKKHQHGIPRGILKYFADSHKRTFQLIKKSKEIVNPKINKVMVHKKLYETKGLPSNFIEDKFAERENSFIPFIGDLITYTEEIYNSHSSSKIIIENILNYIEEFLLLYYRSPGLFNYYKSLMNNHEIQMNIFNQLIKTENFDNLSKTIKEGYNFCIIVDDKERFILSDTYLVTVSTEFKSTGFLPNNTIGLRDTIIFIPLSSKFYFVAFHGKKPKYLKKDKFISLNSKEVNKINYLIGDSAFNICCGKNENSLVSLSSTLKFTEPNIIFYLSDDPEYNEDLIKNGLIRKDIMIKREVFYYKEDRNKAKNDSYKGKKNSSESIESISIRKDLITENPCISIEQKYSELTIEEKELLNECREYIEN